MLILLKKIKYKINDLFVKLLIKFSLFLNWPYLAAIAFWLAASRINPKCRSNYTVLCMGRSVFIDDLNAMGTYSGRIKYVVIWRTYFQMVLHYFIKGPEEKKLTEENYHVSNFCFKGRQRYYLYLKKMFPYLHRWLNFDAVFSGNFAYVEHQELMRVSEENKVPFVVLFKEGIAATASGAYDKWLDMCRGCKFLGARVLFYGDKVRLSLLSINIPGLTENKTKVVGAPRLDVYFTDKENKTDKLNKQVIFFSFYSDNFYNLTDDSGKLQAAKKRCDDFHAWIMNFAKKHKEFKVIIKTKFPDHYLFYVKNIYGKVFKDDKDAPTNLIITNLGNSAQLIKESSAVVGFYSTTLTEAIVAGKISLSPYFGDIITDKPWDYFAEYPELINYVKSEADFSEYILKPEKYLGYSQKQREEFLKELIYIPDGRASIRAEAAIIEAIKEYKK